MTTAQRAGLVDQVIEQLRAGITGGEWPVGERIPTEPALVAQLGVGRNTVREAVRALAHVGLLEVRQGDGTYVRATSEMAGAIRRLCAPELREVLQVRRALEVDGARLAGTARTDADLVELRRLLKRRDSAWDKLSQDAAQDAARDAGKPGRSGGNARDSGDEFARADTAFHSAVVRSGHNDLLFQMHRGLLEAITASVATTSELPGLAAPADGTLPRRQAEQVRHRRLVDAIADADPDRAAAEATDFLDELLALVDPAD
ncbi:FadR/GntR family transcriptional regulator [Nakamurella aerolata]|uniref:FadR family transcriptional regulator n=1 Tax=Nakamurella aerolata TaxID=1656892 RepID=A0A849AGG8_9ACTN|nr:GntR family transcriptional regulator [Nakamurella aerolata]NNG35932.1 FadR family transcriptional regulator [Nakamurella aerolata]